MSLSTSAGEISLSDKCCICWSIPKYKCPRCSARTCSAACIKQHKSRALCSGERNPAVFKKRSQIATPEVFDQDFNYLSGLEKRMADARRQTRQRREVLPAAAAAVAPELSDDEKDRDARKVENAVVAAERRHLLEMIEQRNVIFHGAPEGMSLRAQNLTKWNRKKRQIEWMVEWQFLGSKHRSLASDMKSLCVAHDRMMFDLVDRRQISQRHKEYVKAAGVQLPAKIREHKELNQELGDLTGDEDRRIFYLHLPEFSNSLKPAIVQVDGSDKLRDILYGRTVWEFPKIIVAVPGVDDLDDEACTVKPSVNARVIGPKDGSGKNGDGTKKRKTDDLESGNIRRKI